MIEKHSAYMNQHNQNRQIIAYKTKDRLSVFEDCEDVLHEQERKDFLAVKGVDAVDRNAPYDYA